ncbi:MAG: hypothetical protein QOG85_272 [Gaiellaceae bacterium]|nr:hypothetical protein [Gaiellaceae bacterium]
MLSVTAVAKSTTTTPLKHVTIFGDSSAAALSWDSQARAEIEKANRVTYELQPCGRLTTPGCISPPPPSVLSEVRTLDRRIGPTVIVLVGYNDDPHVYLDGIDTVLRAMHRRGVKQVLWLTLRVQAHPSQYRGTNSVIIGAAKRWPFMTVVPWGAYSGPHPEWFTDGIHFTSYGAVKFATYLHNTLKKYGLTGPIGSTSG